MLAYRASIDLALTYALRRPKLALSLLWDALSAAIKIGRPDLAYQANTLIIVINGGVQL